MDKKVFDYRDYKDYIKDYLSSKPARGRGEKSKLASMMYSQSAFISQVIHGTANFTLEQAYRANEYFGHSDEEAHYFLLLVQLARAGTKELQNYFTKQIEEIQNKRLQLKNRIETKAELSEQNQVVYYSHWLYSAIHILVTIARYQTKDSISEYFKIPLVQATKFLDFLVESGLLQEEAGKYSVTEKRIFLNLDSPLVNRQHTNWRMKAVQAMDALNPENFHYSSVVSISQNDYQKIRKNLLQFIDETRAIIRDSKEEKLFSFCLDFFHVK